MPLIGLYVSAELDNIEKVEFGDVWYLGVVQSGGTETREDITFDSLEENEIPNSKGTANFILKWDGSKAFSSMTSYVPSHKDKSKDLAKFNPVLDASETMKLVKIFDCRGMEPCNWHPRGHIKITTPSGQVFENVDLTDGFCEYDEKASLPVELSGLKHEFKVVK
mmetsp:Transcript_86631/g.245656  ORF Transcript_86631/g.245656 Transcript_86631/m.245656 type:complete len:165 (+) Transcript_86631:117-611(+)|eukprot:CAMPEP_0179288430 /NCGR_PEP_ID=MMETSP0797-20121207/40777_1 /TAXON_ID=47934 /ORGANISM="Dinophysis acuminata, Strain DAEP01" /LENGTH=164 /DNA_ID=CAMNT_0020997393 /DNA_START=116 /DNA_END=610 /DNA_ORIENTATION=+